MIPSPRRTLGKRFVPLACALLLCLHPRAALGNGGPIDDSDGNQIVPLSSDDVQLVRESVQVEFHDGFGWVRCHYLLRNLMAREAALSIGFVRSQEMTAGRGRDFRAWIGERPAAVRWMHADLDRWRPYAGGDLDSLPVWDLRISAADTLSVRCEYPVSFDGGRNSEGANEFFAYRTTAAALWAGVIETADIEIQLDGDWRLFHCTDRTIPPYVEAHIEPPGYRWNGSSLHWRFENWEPSQDITLSLSRANVLRWEEFLECRENSEVDCSYPIEISPYTGDSLLYAQGSLLEAVRDAFTRQFAAAPIASNYEAFAHAYLEVLRLEIAARHGAPFDDGREARFFDVQDWYKADPAYERSRLNAVELANEEALLALERRIEGHPDLLLPLPAVRR